MAKNNVPFDQQYNWRNFWICFLVSLGQIAFGYPSSIIGTTLGEPSFLIYMGIIDAEGNLTSNGAQLEGAMSGVFQVSKPKPCTETCNIGLTPC
jgi:hypothetical protein